jgi:hypothetical protein
MTPVEKLDFESTEARSIINAVFIFCSFGRALLMLSDFSQAKRCLIDAQRIDPENSAISNELKKVCKQKIILKHS